MRDNLQSCLFSLLLAIRASLSGNRAVNSSLLLSTRFVTVFFAGFVFSHSHANALIETIAHLNCILLTVVRFRSGYADTAMQTCPSPAIWCKPAS